MQIGCCISCGSLALTQCLISRDEAQAATAQMVGPFLGIYFN